MRPASALVVLVSSAVLVSVGVGCAKYHVPVGWPIPQLQLPVGATEVYTPETKDLDVYEEMLKAGRSESDIPPAYRGKRVKIWQVAFKYSGQWEALIEHVERALGNAGFRSTTQAIGILTAQSVPPGGDQRAYVSTDYNTIVVLTRYPSKDIFFGKAPNSSTTTPPADVNTPPYYLISITQFSG